MKILKGKTVITSDHGNLFGEIIYPFPVRMYGHPGGIYVKNLVEVPWLVLDSKDRKMIRTRDGEQDATPESVDFKEGNGIKERLQSLGYLD